MKGIATVCFGEYFIFTNKLVTPVLVAKPFNGEGTCLSPGERTCLSPGERTCLSPGEGTCLSPGEGTCLSPGERRRGNMFNAQLDKPLFTMWL